MTKLRCGEVNWLLIDRDKWEPRILGHQSRWAMLLRRRVEEGLVSLIVRQGSAYSRPHPLASLHLPSPTQACPFAAIDRRGSGTQEACGAQSCRTLWTQSRAFNCQSVVLLRGWQGWLFLYSVRIEVVGKLFPLWGDILQSYKNLKTFCQML